MYQQQARAFQEMLKDETFIWSNYLGTYILKIILMWEVVTDAHFGSVLALEYLAWKFFLFGGMPYFYTEIP